MNKAYELAGEEIGTWEWAEGHNPKVLQYFKDVGHAWVKDDETAWCAAFVGAMLKRAGYPHTGKLTARSYLKYSTAVDLPDAKEGDICVFKRGNSSWQGHVGFFVKRRGNQILLRGGNQKNQVNESWYRIDGRNPLLGIRRVPPLETAEAELGPVDEDSIDDLLSMAVAKINDLPDGPEKQQALIRAHEASFWAGHAEGRA